MLKVSINVELDSTSTRIGLQLAQSAALKLTRMVFAPETLSWSSDGLAAVSVLFIVYACSDRTAVAASEIWPRR